MPIRQVPDSDRQYYLIAHDKSGNERRDDPDGRMSELVLAGLEGGGTTDVFIVSHGWKGDVPAAIEQYDRWIGAMTRQTADLARMRARDPAYRPMIIGLHWPSQPWGEEEFGGGAGAFSSTARAAGTEFDLPSRVPTAEELIERYADRLSDSEQPDPELHEQLRRIFAASRENIAPLRLPDDVVQAYRRVNELAALGSAGPAGAPGEDREPFDPQRAYRATKAPTASFGGGSLLGGLLSPLRQLSFWKMKKRAQTFGEGGAAALLERLQAAAGDQVRFHVAGHSFGSIVVAAMLRGRDGAAANRRQIASATLLQGALSHWSFCSQIEQADNAPGYFHPVLAGGRVTGPIVTTQSRFDKAVGFWYPKAAGVAGQVAFAPGLGDLPKFGAIGTFGVQGPGTDAQHLEMLPLSASYGFRPGRVYNVNADQYIKNGGGFSGAHSDIAHPEVAHTMWEAVLAGVR